jgi:Protein of unknown function (DUF992)
LGGRHETEDGVEGFASRIRGTLLSSQRGVALVQSSQAAEYAYGAITTLGLDIGITAGGVMGWAVLISTTDLYLGALAGTYVGCER